MDGIRAGAGPEASETQLAHGVNQHLDLYTICARTWPFTKHANTANPHLSHGVGLQDMSDQLFFH